MDKTITVFSKTIYLQDFLIILLSAVVYLFAICSIIACAVYLAKLGKNKNGVKQNVFKKYLFEIVYLVLSIAILIASAIVFKSEVLVPICTILGLVGSVLNSKGSAFCYLLAMSSSIMYGIVSLKANFLGEVILHFGLLVPLYIYSLIKWLKPNKNKSSESSVRPMYSMSVQKIVFIAIVGVIMTAVYGLILKYALKSAFPFLNAASTVCLLLANFLGAKRVLQQWYVYILGNVVLILLWLLSGNKGNYPIFIQNALYVIINIRGIHLWVKAIGRRKEKPVEPADC